MTDKHKILTINNASEAIYFLENEMERRTKIFWTMKNGDKIDITEMSDTHLTNTIELLRKQIQLDEINGYDLNYGD
jgi:hypothetical protein